MRGRMTVKPSRSSTREKNRTIKVKCELRPLFLLCFLSLCGVSWPAITLLTPLRFKELDSIARSRKREVARGVLRVLLRLLGVCTATACAGAHRCVRRENMKMLYDVQSACCSKEIYVVNEHSSSAQSLFHFGGLMGKGT